MSTAGVLTGPELARRAEAALYLARRAGTLITDANQRPKASLKGPADWVTSTDVAVEGLVRQMLGDLFPEDDVVGEEMENLPLRPGHPVWYLDPVDGTTNFVHGLKACAFSLCVADGGGLAAGVVADPWRDELFTATRGGGAFCGDKRLSCRPDTALEGGLVLTELEGPAPWDGMTALVEHLGAQRCVTRILGSCALSLANVAAGRAAAVVLGGAHPIDVGAGVLLALEAGAVVHTSDKTGRLLGRGDLGARPALVASCPGLDGELLAMVGAGTVL